LDKGTKLLSPHVTLMLCSSVSLMEAKAYKEIGWRSLARTEPKVAYSPSMMLVTLAVPDSVPVWTNSTPRLLDRLCNAFSNMQAQAHVADHRVDTTGAWQDAGVRYVDVVRAPDLPSRIYYTSRR